MEDIDIMNLQENIKIPDIKYFVSNPRGHLMEKHIRNKFPEFYKLLMSQYPDDLKFSERIYWYFHNIHEYPVCCECHKNRVRYISFNEGYLQFCSYKCSDKSPVRIKKLKQTIYDKYGVDNVSKSESIKEKKRKTTLEHYGVEYPLQSPRIQEQIKQTIYDKYGVDNVSKSESIKEKKRKTTLEHYGVEYPLQSPRIQEQIKQTIYDKYGVGCILEIYQEKSKENYYKIFLKNNPQVISIDSDETGIWYTCKCPHYNSCTKCKSKTYRIQNNQYNSRKYAGVELCTTLLPIQYDKISNTTLEIFVRRILETYNIRFEINNRVVLSGKELDIYIPDYNLAIECNGVYWHSLKKPDYHYNKWLKCKDQNIELLTLWEDQIMYKSDIVKNIIKEKLNILDNTINIEKCIVKNVSSEESNSFLIKNSIYGPIEGSIRLGLYYNEEIIAIMVLGNKRGPSKNNKNVWRIYRFCVSLGMNIPEAIGILFNKFISTHQDCIIEVVTDNDIPIGNLYEFLGFELKSLQKPSYWYIDKNIVRYPKHKFGKNKYTETNLMKIYNSGSQLWIYNKS